MPTERNLLGAAHGSQVVFAGFHYDATGSAECARAAYMHQANAVLQRAAEESTAAAHFNFLAVELDGHDIGSGGHLFQPGGKRFFESAICNATSGLDDRLYSCCEIQIVVFSTH